MPPQHLLNTAKKNAGSSIFVFIIIFVVLSSCGLFTGNLDTVSNSADTIPVIQVLYPFKLTDAGRNILHDRDKNKFFEVIVEFRDQLDVMAYGKRLRSRYTKKARRQKIVDALKYVSQRHTDNMRNILEDMVKRGIARSPEFLTIQNQAVVQLTGTALTELMQYDAVARIIPEYEYELKASSENQENPPLNYHPDFKYQWWPSTFRIQELWARSIDGQGVVVGLLDSGVDNTHEQLHGSMLPLPRGWYDPGGRSTDPYDSHTHGTGVLSCAVGKNPDGKIVGVAPAAKWVAGLSNPENRYHNIKLAQCADWILNVAQPDVLICAWGHEKSMCQDFERAYMDAWKAAEIFCVFAAGNEGPEDSTDISPANLAGLFPGNAAAFSIGASAYGYRAYNKSSRGPNTCDPDMVYPRLCAPGNEIYHADPRGNHTYRLGNGTSYAAGLAAGLAALTIQKYPEAGVDEIESILIGSALDLGIPGPDNTFGYGLIQFPQ